MTTNKFTSQRLRRVKSAMSLAWFPTRLSCRGRLSDYSEKYDDQDDSSLPCFIEKAYQDSLTSPTCSEFSVNDPHSRLEHARSQFLQSYPEYAHTRPLDLLRQRDYARLEDSGETYVDYMGGSLYPESLVADHLHLLCTQTFGNTHSINASSARSSAHADAARQAVLKYFDAPVGDYEVIFTSNASAALKLVGESFPFTFASSFVLAEDSHNSVHGIRQFAQRAGATVAYIPPTTSGGFELSVAQDLLTARATNGTAPSLLALTGLSNVTNHKAPTSLLELASILGYSTLLDAAALAATSRISLRDIPVDAMAVSFYKMFGYPTGVGALIAKKSFLRQLNRPWFAGGTVDVVQVPGNVMSKSLLLHEQFEDGTINYLSLPAISAGLRILDSYMPFLPLRLSILLHSLGRSLADLRHTNSNRPVVRLLSHMPEDRLHSPHQNSSAGFVLSFVFLDSDGVPLPLELISHASAARHIALRTGCMCNPGGAAALLGLRSFMERLGELPDASLAALEQMAGHSLGVVRVSLGLATIFDDIWRIIEFAREVADAGALQQMVDIWRADPFGKHPIACGTMAVQR